MAHSTVACRIRPFKENGQDRSNRFTGLRDLCIGMDRDSDLCRHEMETEAERRGPKHVENI